jgi:hypothetical protein
MKLLVPYNELVLNANKPDARIFVSDYLFQHYELAQFSPADQALWVQVLEANMLGCRPSKKMSQDQKNQVALWGEVRVEGDFWFCGFDATGGALFAQLGGAEGDECVYVVKGLASTFTELFAQRIAYDAEDATLGFPFTTVLLPWADTITYFGTILPPSFTFPKQLEELCARCSGVVARCRAHGRVLRSLTASDARVRRFLRAYHMAHSRDCTR